MHGVRLSLTILIATLTVLNFDTNYKLYDLALFISYFLKFHELAQMTC